MEHQWNPDFKKLRKLAGKIKQLTEQEKMNKQDCTVKFTAQARKEFNILKAEFSLGNASDTLKELIKTYCENNKI